MNSAFCLFVTLFLCECVPGVWSREIAAMAGLQLPIVPMKHSYIVSERVPEVRGLPNIRDHDASTYFRIQGESICMGGYEYNPILLDKVRNNNQLNSV